MGMLLPYVVLIIVTKFYIRIVCIYNKIGIFLCGINITCYQVTKGGFWMMNQIAYVIRGGSIEKEYISIFDFMAIESSFIAGPLKRVENAEKFFLNTILDGTKGFTQEELKEYTNNNIKELERNLDILLDSTLFSAKWVFDEKEKVWYRRFFNKNEISEYLKDEIIICTNTNKTKSERIRAKNLLQRKIELM